MNFLRAISNLLRFDRTNWKALALCVFAAAIFWIFNALNKNYATNLSFPLQFEYDGSKYVPAGPVPSSLTLNVSANGWELFRKGLGLKVPTISLPLDRPVETRKITGSTLSPMVASQVGALQVNYIVTDTLRLKFEPRLFRKIKLLADLKNVSFRKNFGRTSPAVILPDSVALEGPKSFIENLGDTLSLKVFASRIAKNFRENVEVVLENYEYISRNPPVAEVIFEVGPVEEIVCLLILKVPRIPRGVEVDRDSVRSVWVVPQKEHQRFISEVATLSASFDMVEVKKGATRSILPAVRGLPPYAQLVLIDSIKVKKL